MASDPTSESTSPTLPPEAEPIVYRHWFAGRLVDAYIALWTPLWWLGGKPLHKAVCHLMAALLYVTMPERRRIALTNLDLVFGDTKTPREKRRIIYRMYHHFTRFFLDLTWHKVYWPAKRRATELRAVNAEALDRAVKEGRGVLIVSAHMGNWEMLAGLIAERGKLTYGIYKQVRNDFLDELIVRRRATYGMQSLQKPVAFKGEERRSIRDVVREVWAAGGVICILADQNARKSTLRIPFLGIPDTQMAPGGIAYAVDFQVPILLPSLFYDDDGGATWTVEGPIVPEMRPEGRDATVEYYARLVNDWMSERIRQHPEQWLWAHRRFARRYYKTD